MLYSTSSRYINVFFLEYSLRTEMKKVNMNVAVVMELYDGCAILFIDQNTT